MKSGTHNSIELAIAFRDSFDPLFKAAEVNGEEAIVLPITSFDDFLISLESYPTDIDQETGYILPPCIPEPGTAEHHRHINFRNQIRRLINSAASVGSHIDEEGNRRPAYEIHVHYLQGPKYKRGPKQGQHKRVKDQAHYEIRLLSRVVRVLHSEVAKALHTYATGKVKYLNKMEKYIDDHLEELPFKDQVARAVRGKRTQKAISLAAQIVADDIKETHDEYNKVVAVIGDKNPPIPKSRQLGYQDPDRPDDDDSKETQE